MSWSASLAEFEHVQLTAEYAWFEGVVKKIFERVQFIADCRLPIADLIKKRS
jgi:hypothetical protein